MSIATAGHKGIELYKHTALYCKGSASVVHPSGSGVISFDEVLKIVFIF